MIYWNITIITYLFLNGDVPVRYVKSPVGSRPSCPPRHPEVKRALLLRSLDVQPYKHGLGARARARWRRRFNGSFLSSTDWFKGKFTGNPIFNEKSMVSCRLQPIQWSVELVKPILSNTGVWHYNNMMWWFWLSRLYQPSIFLTKFWVLTPIVWYIREWGVSGRQTIELFANIHTTVKSISVEKAKERTIKLVSVQRYKVCEFYVAEFWPLDVDRHKWKVLKLHKCLVVSTLLQNNMSVCVYECRYVFLSPILLSLYIYMCVCVNDLLGNTISKIGWTWKSHIQFFPSWNHPVAFRATSGLGMTPAFIFKDQRTWPGP